MEKEYSDKEIINAVLNAINLVLHYKRFLKLQKTLPATPYEVFTTLLYGKQTHTCLT